MITLRDYIKNVRLEEELTQKQKKKVDEMPDVYRSIQEKHDSVFGKGNDKIILPYDSSEDDPITSENASRLLHHQSHASTVIRGLNSAGYRVNDYESGLAHHVDKPDRKLKIGKILESNEIGKHVTHIKNRVGTQLNLKQAYDADPIRASSKNGQKQIVITRNRYDVAGMSTGRSGWSSCMDMEGGCNRHYLPRDMEHGTITAYVTKKGDDSIQEPIGRINLKRFENPTHGDIFRPEGRGYGSMPKNAKKQIEDWAGEHYPSKPGIYMKNHELYNDDGQSVRIEHPDKMIEVNTHEDTRKMYDGFADQVVRNIKNAREEQIGKEDHFGGLHDEFDARDEMYGQVSQALKPLPHATKLHIAAHYLADKLSDDDGKTFHEHDIDYDIRSGDPVMRHWAHQYVHNNNRINIDLENAIGELKPDEALAYHKKFHDAAAYVTDPAEHESATELHAKLIDHIIDHGQSHHANEVIRDITDGSDADRNGYYHNMMKTHKTVFDDYHPTELLKDPRAIHHILSGDDSIFESNGISDNKSAWNHIGQHADEKLTKEWRQGDLKHHNDDDDTQYEFYKGLAKNPHGESISHAFLNDHINLTGGESKGQSSTHDAFRNINGYRVVGGKINDRWRDSFIDPSSDHDLHSHLVDLAHTTPHKSVIDVLKNRSDMKDDSEIQDAIKRNPHGEQ